MTTVETYFLAQMSQTGKLATNPNITSVPFQAQSGNSKSGVSLTGYKDIIARGGNATTAFSGFRRTVLAESGLASLSMSKFPYGTSTDPYLDRRWGHSIYLHSQRPLENVSADLMKRLDQQAWIRLTKAVRAAQQEISGPTFLGELRETVGMLKRPFVSANRLLKRYGDYVFGRGKGFRTTSRHRQAIVASARDSWLEIAFGLNPLIADAAGIAGAIDRLLSNERHTVVRGYAGDSERGTHQESSWQTLGWHQVSTVNTAYNDYFVLYRGGVGASVLEGPFNSLQRIRMLFGFSLDNFAPTLYELMPWSFVVDYFSNLGSIIDSAAVDMSSLSWLAKTTRSRTVWHRLAKVRANSGNPSGAVWFSEKGHLGKLIETVSQVNRYPADPNRWYPYFLESKLPSIDSSKWVNLIALLHGRFDPS